MDIQTIVRLVGVVGTAERVYMELLSKGPQSAAFLAKKLSLPRPTIYDALHVLEQKSMVVSQEENHKSVFSISDPRNILQILDASMERFKNARMTVEKKLPELLRSPRVTEPKIRMFSGREGCQQTMRDILWYENITTYTLWPMHKMIKTLTPEFLEWHNNRRVSKHIALQSIRKAQDKSEITKYPFLGSTPKDLRKIRFLPKSVDLSMSYWIYENNVAFISAGEELYGFIVQSKEFADMMKFNFDLLWDQSKEK